MDGSSPARKARARAIVQRMGTPVFGHSASMPVVGSTPVFWSDLMREANDYRQAPLPPSGDGSGSGGSGGSGAVSYTHLTLPTKA